MIFACTAIHGIFPISQDWHRIYNIGVVLVSNHFLKPGLVAQRWCLLLDRPAWGSSPHVMKPFLSVCLLLVIPPLRHSGIVPLVIFAVGSLDIGFTHAFILLFVFCGLYSRCHSIRLGLSEKKRWYNLVSQHMQKYTTVFIDVSHDVKASAFPLGFLAWYHTA